MNYMTELQLGGKNIPIAVNAINETTEMSDISRVYVIACDHEGNIGLIYNSKRGIRGFPGGHTEQSETILETAHREYIEEMGYDIGECSPRYLIQNQIDVGHTEKQVICFGRIGNPNDSKKEENESVTEIGFFSMSEVLEKIGNRGLRESIVTDFGEKFFK